MKKVLVFGTFDIYHPGHAYFLREAKGNGKCLYVCVARDRSVQKIKGIGPVNDEMRRMHALVDTGIPDHVVLGYEDDFFRIIKEVGPDQICLGYDQESFGVEKAFPEIHIRRIKPFKEKQYKSSMLKAKNGNL